MAKTLLEYSKLLATALTNSRKKLVLLYSQYLSFYCFSESDYQLRVCIQATLCRGFAPPGWLSDELVGLMTW